MVQILQVTLREVEFKSDVPTGSKTTIKIVFGESEKKIPNPRIVKNNICNFYGERISLNSNLPESIQKAYAQISLIEGKQEKDYGEVEIDIIKVKEQKDGSKVKLELENDDVYLDLEVLFSSYGGTSEIDNRSEKSESLLSPLRPKSTIGTEQKSKQIEKNNSSFTPASKTSGNFGNRQSFQFNKKISLNNTVGNKFVEEDRKSEISERPIRRSIKRNNDNELNSRQHSATRSAIKSQTVLNKSQSTNVQKRQVNKVEQKSIRTPPPQRQRRNPKPQTSQSKKKEEQESGVLSFLKQFQSRDYLHFVGISFAALFAGILVRIL